MDELDPYRDIEYSPSIVKDKLDLLEEKVAILECFAMGREKCTGDAVFDLLKEEKKLTLTRIRLLALAVVITMMFVFFYTATAWTDLSEQINETQEQIRRLEEDHGRSADRLQRAIRLHRERSKREWASLSHGQQTCCVGKTE